MSCFRGGVDGGSAGCQTSLRQKQPSPRATCLWVLGLHSSLRPGLRLPRHTKTGRQSLDVGRAARGPFLPVNVQPCGRECAGKKLGTYLCEASSHTWSHLGPHRPGSGIGQG